MLQSELIKELAQRIMQITADTPKQVEKVSLKSQFRRQLELNNGKIKKHAK